MTTTIPTAEIIHQLLDDENMDAMGWSMFIGFLPFDPDEAIAVYDTAGLDDGRLMRTGERIIHHGFQIQTRSITYANALEKIQQIALMLDTRDSVIVSLDGTDYLIHAIMRTGDILPMGVEDQDRLRQYFSLNAVATIDKVSS